MDIVLYVIGVLVVSSWLWLNFLATIAVRHDLTLEPIQRKGQTAIIWLFPFVGAAFVLHLIWQHHPEAIPKAWVPWPFKKPIYGEKNATNRNRNDDESAAINGSVHRSRDFHSGGNGESGGSD